MLKSTKNAAYIIAEIGQNHQGELGLAEKYIKDFASIGADAIKFQKRDMDSLFSEEKLNSSYESDAAFAGTYGAHRKLLEFDIDQMRYLKEVCNKVGVDFMCTAFDEVSLSELLSIDCDLIKLASFDMGNIRLIEKAIQSGKKVILSSGGSRLEIIDLTYKYFRNVDNIFTLLHCVSQYPCPASNLNLEKMKTYTERFPNCQIGLSDHFSGPLSGPVGFCAGAEVFEKHVTFNRAWKGTDHSFALSQSGFRQFVKDINRAAAMQAKKVDDSVLGNEPVFNKLGKTLVADADISVGELFSTRNLTGRILNEPSGISVREMVNLLGKSAKKNYTKGDPIIEKI